MKRTLSICLIFILAFLSDFLIFAPQVWPLSGNEIVVTIKEGVIFIIWAIFNSAFLLTLKDLK